MVTAQITMDNRDRISVDVLQRTVLKPVVVMVVDIIQISMIVL
jgi:hypothetical protein